MMQIQFQALVNDVDYRSRVQEEFREGFSAVPDPELQLAVSAYCFWLAVPQTTADLTCKQEDLAYIQLMHTRQYSYMLLVKKLSQYPKLLDLANALADLTAAGSCFDGQTLGLPKLSDSFAALPQDIKNRYA